MWETENLFVRELLLIHLKHEGSICGRKVNMKGINRTMKRIWAFLFGLMSFSLLANDLSLLTDTSRATGEVRVYIKNVSNKEQSVLTRNLTITRGNGEVTLSPDRHVLIIDRTRIVLKEDLAYYGIVHLKPGETTYISNSNVDVNVSTVRYKIVKEWGDMHGLWTGIIETPLSN